jgi:hypothetical protein
MNDKELRVAILASTRDIYPSKTRPLVASDYVKHLNLQGEDSLTRVRRALQYHRSAGNLEIVFAGPKNVEVVIGITARGIDTVESSNEPKSYSPGTTHFHGPVASN